MNTPLHTAISCQSQLPIKLVLNLGADPLIKNAFGETAIDLAIKLNSSRLIMDLLKESLIR